MSSQGDFKSGPGPSALAIQSPGCGPGLIVALLEQSADRPVLVCPVADQEDDRESSPQCQLGESNAPQRREKDLNIGSSRPVGKLASIVAQSPERSHSQSVIRGIVHGSKRQRQVDLDRAAAEDFNPSPGCAARTTELSLVPSTTRPDVVPAQGKGIPKDAGRGICQVRWHWKSTGRLGLAAPRWGEYCNIADDRPVGEPSDIIIHSPEGSHSERIAGGIAHGSSRERNREFNPISTWNLDGYPTRVAGSAKLGFISAAASPDILPGEGNGLTEAACGQIHQVGWNWKQIRWHRPTAARGREHVDTDDFRPFGEPLDVIPGSPKRSDSEGVGGGIVHGSIREWDDDLNRIDVA